MSAGAIAWAAKDPVVMTINGEDVPKSEFEYLYHKNSQQQIEAQPLEEYVGMFELYKMKVADAKAAGIDTTADFRSDMVKYRRDLALPYVADSVYLNSLVDEAYEHSLTELDYYHIMLAKGRTAAEMEAAHQKADSLKALIENGADFETLAKANSVDRTVQANGGHLGFMASGRLPYGFEHAAYSLKPGELDIVESNAGIHLIKVGDSRPAKGSVRAAHIMKRVSPTAEAEAQAKAKAQIDSIYSVLMENPADFEKLAQTLSDDQGSARMGGQIGWFVSGMMVPEFSEAAFALPVGGIGEPVKSDYGWHIIKKLDEAPVRSRAAIKPELLQRFDDQRDDRYKMVRANRIKNLSKKHKGVRNAAAFEAMKQYVEQNGVDSVFYVTFSQTPDVVFTVEGTPTTTAQFVATLNNAPLPDPYYGAMMLDDKYDSAFDEALIGAEEDWLYANNADYRNLLNEYRDGSLLYEISLQKVWDKAANDTEGLENYFNAHRSEYKFKEPRAKGFLVLAKNDSVADLVKARYAEIDKENALLTMRNEFRNEAVIDRLLASQGINRFVDYLLFDGPEPEVNQKFPVYFILDPRVVAEPEEMIDVKGAVTSDYQQELEQEWAKDLRRRYPVKRNDRELKKVK